jgi:hypothetical protein
VSPFLLAVALAVSLPQATPEPPPTPAPSAASSSQAEDDLEIDPLEPDYVVVNLPTTAPLPRHKLVFRLTHRFARGLSEGDFSDLAADLFGFDGGAQIGLELRFGVTRSTQFGIYRTSDRTIEFFLTQNLLRQGESAPLSLQAEAAVEGLDNFAEEYSPKLGVTLSRHLGDRVALFLSPSYVGNTNLIEADPEDDDSSFVLGMGARLRIAKSTSLLAEVHPRVAGFDNDRDSLVAFGIEHTIGGHAFQLNFQNDLGTTPAQIARGQAGKEDWFIGFNLARKFW